MMEYAIVFVAGAAVGIAGIIALAVFVWDK